MAGNDEMTGGSSARVNRRRLLAGVAAGGASLAVGGPFAGNALAAADRARKAKYHYIYVAFISTISYWNGPKAGLRYAARDLGITYDFVGPTTYDIQKQIDAVNQAVLQKPDGIITLPIQNKVLDNAIKNALDHKIPVVTHEQGPIGKYELGYLGFDRAEAGAIGADILAKAITSKGGTVGALIYDPAVQSMQDGLRGFKQRLKEIRPDLKVVDGVDKADPEYGTTLCSQMLQAHPDMKAFMSIDTSGGPSAARAVKAAGKKLPVIAGGLNEQNTEVWPLIENGQILAGLAASAALEVYTAVEYLNALNNKAIGGIDWRKNPALHLVPRNTDVGTYVVTKNNVKALMNVK
jgi:ribose transport system substrate-binding protein